MRQRRGEYPVAFARMTKNRLGEYSLDTCGIFGCPQYQCQVLAKWTGTPNLLTHNVPVRTLRRASGIFRFVLEPEGSPAGHPCRGRHGLVARGTAREAVEVEDLTPTRRRRAAEPMRTHRRYAARFRPHVCVGLGMR